MSNATALTDDEFDAWTNAKVQEVLDAARAELGTNHPDYPSVLGVIGDSLMMESRRGRQDGGRSHLHPVD